MLVYDLGVKGQSQIFLKCALRLVTHIPFSCFNGVCSLFSDVQVKLSVTDCRYNLEVMVRVTHDLNLTTARIKLSIISCIWHNDCL